MESIYLERADAAEYLTAQGLRVSKNTLQKWATTGGGPRYRRFGLRAVYTRSDLDMWAEAKLSAPRHSAIAAAIAA
jgi:hypothetical protein